VPVALISLVRRNRRRYGGYLVHVGVSVLFVGVAGSSAFQDARDVQLRPGQSARVGGYDITYERTTADLQAASNGRLEKIDLGAVLRVRRDGRTLGRVHTERSYFPSSDPSLGPVSRFFEGEATSEVGLKAGWRRDVWSAISPDINRLRPRIAEGDRVFARAQRAGLPPAQAGPLLVRALQGLTRDYASKPPPATLRLLVSPLVSWVWIGALIVFAGGLIALWPPPGGLRRPAAAAYRARVARELEPA
jgi:cytochrome c-type biogenesis protein CcmF